MKKFVPALALCAVLSVTGMAVATSEGAPSHSPAHETMPMAPSDAASTVALKAANEKMHHDMNIVYTGDADVDFVRGMIAHHQGAIDMAKVVLEFGKDPAIKTLAEGIVKAQEQEVEMMQQWLVQHAPAEKASLPVENAVPPTVHNMGH